MSKEHEWIVGSDTGISSKTIWSVMMAGTVPPSGYSSPPSDPSDFGRCHRLLDLCPEWRARLPEVSSMLPEWTALVREWPELTRIYLSEMPGGKCPKLYARMKELIDEGRIVAGWTKTGPGYWRKGKAQSVELGAGVTFSTR